MKPIKTIKFDFVALDNFLSTLYTHWSSVSNKRNPERLELYGAYLVRKFYERLSKRQNNMVQLGQQAISVKFDMVHAILIVDVLQQTPANYSSNQVLAELGKVGLTKMKKP
ncbi:MAG TPA: hypothetical protein VIM65_01285 [Cyclobacteriaceae bacterium]